MAEWTTAMVEDRLTDAASVMKRLPPVRVQGYFSAWPEIVQSFADKVGQQPKPMRLQPSPRAITQAEEAMLWLRWLETEDARLVWARAEGTAWKPICWQFGISRATADRRYQYGLAVIVWQLSGKRPPTKRSMSYLIERVRGRVNRPA